MEFTESEHRLMSDPLTKALLGAPQFDPTWAAKMRELGRQPSDDVADCVCVHSCAEDPATACSLSGDWHVHPDDGRDLFGPCPVHPEAPGDL